MTTQHYSKFLRQISWILPISIAICMVPLLGTRVSPDGALYLAQGLNLYLGNGYVEADGALATRRGQMFPWLLSIYFHIFGVSVYSGLLLIRTFFVLNVATVYLYGRKLIGPFTGMMAALLVLTAFSLHRWSARIHLDIIMPFFMLSAILLLYYAFERKHIWLFALSGLVLGIAAITKELALLLAPLPTLMWILISEYRTRRNFFGVCLSYLLLIAVITPWLYGLVQDREVFAGVQRTSEWVLRSATGIESSSTSTATETMTQTPNPSTDTQISLPQLIFVPIKSLFERLNIFYQDFVAKEFLLAPLLILAWCITFIRAIFQHSKKDIFLSLSLLCFMPIVLFLGAVSYRGGQVYFVYLLSFVVLSYQMVALFRALNLSTLGHALLLVFIVIQMWIGDTRLIKLFTHQDAYGYVVSSNSYGFGLLQDRWTLASWFAEPIPQVGKWLEKNLMNDEAVLSDWQWLNSYYFYAKGKQPIYEIEYLSSQLQRNGAIEAKSPVRFIWTQAGRVDPDAALSHLLAFSEAHFLSQVKETNAQYIVTGQRRNFLATYLRFHPDFMPTAFFGNGQIQIFRVLQNAELKVQNEFPLYISYTVPIYLRNMRAQKGNDGYTKLIQTYLQDELNLNSKIIYDIESENISTYKHSAVISPQVYAAQMGQSMQLLGHAIDIYEQQRLSYPANPHLHIDLAFLYQQAQRYDLAQTSFLQAISLSEQTSSILPLLALTYPDLEIEGENILQEPLIASLRAAIDKNLGGVQTYWQLASIYELTRNWDEALAIYDDALAVWADSAGTMIRIAQLYQTQTDLEEAKIAYRAALEMQPDDDTWSIPTDIHIEIGKILLEETQNSVK